MCPARQVSVLKRQRSGLNQLIKMLQSPFSPLAGAFIRHFQTEPEFKLLKKKSVYLWPLQGVWPAQEIAPRSILSVIKALKSAAGWLSQIYSTLNKFRGIFTTALRGFASLRSLLDGASRGDGERPGRFSFAGFFFHFTLFPKRKTSSPAGPQPHRTGA